MFHYKYFFCSFYILKQKKKKSRSGFTRTVRYNHHILLNWVMYSLRFILENPSVLDQYKLKQLLFYTLHYEQIPAVVNTDYLSCQFDKPGRWSSCLYPVLRMQLYSVSQITAL